MDVAERLELEGRHLSVVGISRYFAWKHLPEGLQPISESCYWLMVQMVDELPDSPELAAGLRKLLEAKDCFVRAALDR